MSATDSANRRPGYVTAQDSVQAEDEDNRCADCLVDLDEHCEDCQECDCACEDKRIDDLDDEDED